MLCLAAQPCPTLCDPMTVAPRVLSPWDSSDKNTGVGCCALLQGIFPTQGSIPGLLQCRQIFFFLPADPPGKPKNTGRGSLSLLQGIFLTQKLNQGLLHCRWILYQLTYLGSPIKHKLKLLNSLLYYFKWLPHILLCAHNMIYLMNLILVVSILFYYKQ